MDSEDERALLVGISGIDAAGKGFVARAWQKRCKLVVSRSRSSTSTVGSIFRLFGSASSDPSRQFYEHGVRFDSMSRSPSSLWSATYD